MLWFLFPSSLLLFFFISFSYWYQCVWAAVSMCLCDGVLPAGWLWLRFCIPPRAAIVKFLALEREAIVQTEQRKAGNHFWDPRRNLSGKRAVHYHTQQRHPGTLPPFGFGGSTHTENCTIETITRYPLGILRPSATCPVPALPHYLRAAWTIYLRLELMLA